VSRVTLVAAAAFGWYMTNAGESVHTGWMLLLEIAVRTFGCAILVAVGRAWKGATWEW
jgi:hypothetical protein